MFTNNDELDNVTFNVLLLLSGGQKLTFKDICHNTEQPSERIRLALQTLFVRKLASSDKGRYIISLEGVEFLSRRGIPATESGDDPSPDSFKNKYKISLFGNWDELAKWIMFPAILLFLGSIIGMAYNLEKEDTFLSVFSIVAILMIFVLLFFYVKKSWRNIGETEKMVVFRLGKFAGTREAGPALIIPILDKAKIVDVREKSKEIKDEPCLTRDNIQVRVGLFITWEVDDPVKNIMKVVDAEDTMQLFTIAVLRGVVSEFSLAQVLENRNGIANLIRVRLERTIGEWGLSIKALEIRDIKPPQGILERIEKRLIANIESETKLTHADTQVETLRRLFAIGSQLDEKTFRLKYLETLTKIGEGPSTKYIIPMEFINLLGDWLHTQLAKTNQNNQNH